MQATGDSITVLHVDDQPDFADMAAAFLEREDDQFTVETATSASEGLKRLAESDVDCVVSDYDMPGLNGIEFLEDVREEYPDLPFVLFTGKGSEEVASDAISAGATDYLQKEGSPEQYQLLANRIRNTVEQYRTQRRAVELDRIRTLASEINRVLVRANSRPAVETRVCEIISDSEPYLFAWIGGVEPETGRITPRTSAGIEEGYLDEITVTADDAPTGQGPGGTAIRERRVAVSQNVATDPEFAPWQDEALERGYRAVAAVPLEHRDTLYGELLVYAAHANAFNENERELLAELGDNIARAFHSFDVRDRLRTERDQRQALFANAPVPVIAGEVDGHGTHQRIVDVNDAFEEVFGYEFDAVVGKDVSEVVVPEDGTERHEAFRARTTAGKATVTEVERVTADGPREFLLTIIPYGTDDEPAEGWYAWYTDISARNEREEAIAELHRTTDTLLEAQTPEKIAEIVVDAVRDVLDMPANAVHLYDERERRLQPVSWTDRVEELVGEPPAFDPGESLAWEVFETGEAQVHSDVSGSPGRLRADTAIRSEIILPLDDCGVVLISSSAPDAFDETDVSLARTLAAHATTALKRTEREDELTRRKLLFEAVVETSNEGILVIDENREYLAWNQQFVDMWGIPEELLGDEPEERGLEWALDQLENPEEFIDTVEYLYEHPHEKSRDQLQLTDGRVFDRYSAPVEADDGTDFGRVWFFRDITEREQRERELARQSERLEAFSTAFPDLAFLLDEEGRYRGVLAGDDTDGLLYDNGVGLRESHLHEVFSDEQADRFLSVIRTAIETAEERTVEYSLDVPAGERWFEGRIAPLSYELDGKQAVVWVSRDITEQREKRARLQQYRYIVNEMDQAACIYDEEGRFVTVNEYLAEWYGTTPSALEGERSTLVERIRASSGDDPFEALVRGKRDTVSGEFEGDFPGHGHATIAYRLSRLTMDGEFRGVIAVTRDVTDRRRREDAISELHQATRELFRAESEEEVADCVAEAVSEILEYPSNVVRLIDDDGTHLRPVAITKDAETMLGERPVYEVGEGTAGRAFEQGERLLYEDVREFDDGRDRKEARAGLYLPIGEYGTLSVNDTTPGVFDETDIQLAEVLTANAEAALDRLGRISELQRQNERLEEFTGIVSHDLRNPLNVAEGRLDLAQADCDSPHLDDADAALERIQTLIDDLLAYAREGKEVHEPERIGLAELASGCWQTMVTADATLTVETDRTIRGDPGRVQELLENLFRNSIDHTDGAVTITVGDLEDGFYVADDGPGIPEKDRDRVFESGYSTAESGTGFGLGIVEQIAESHGWDVRVTDSETGGARFEITGV